MKGYRGWRRWLPKKESPKPDAAPPSVPAPPAEG